MIFIVLIHHFLSQSSQEQIRAANAAEAQNQFTHKNSDGNWVWKDKPKNVVTLTIERYAREHHLEMAH